MKKNVLALSITAALVGLGFAGGAQAIGLATTTGNPVPAGAGVALRTSVDGIGQFLYVPYYSVQANNNTMINLVNTDTTNGKAVKVRFRGAANSDDVFDFQVFLSPGDVWTANVYKDGNNQARLYTADASCTKPSKGSIAQPAALAAGTLNGTPFSTVRLDPKRLGDALLNEAREGYVELFNMADIRPGTALFTAIKHVNGVAPCTGSAWTGLDSDPLDAAAANAKGLYVPTTGLMANWIILNVVDAGSWSGAATAINAVDGSANVTTGAITYFPQTNESLGLSATRIAQFTADPVLRAIPAMAATYDLPDFSIPYTASADPADQVARLSGAIATRAVVNEFLTSSAIHATTDWVLSMPTRRYSAAYDYANSTTRYTVLSTDYFTSANTTVIDRQICVRGTTLVSYDQEERTATDPGASVIISPQVPGTPTSFYVCGEASVLSFNNGEIASSTGLITSASGTLKATVARSAVDNGYAAGWSYLSTTGIANNGLPILGYEAVRATATTGTFGATLEHRTARINK